MGHHLVAANAVFNKFNGLVTNCIMSERLAETTREDGKVVDEDVSKEVLAMLYAGQYKGR